MDIKAANLLELEKEKECGTLVCKSRPVIMWLETTSRCNLKCITCPRTYLPFFKGRDLDSEVFEIVKRELFPYLQLIWLHDFGEPLLAKEFEAIFDETLKNNVEVTITTNGTLLTEKWLRKFLQYGTQFAVSIDGASEETFRRIRNGAELKKITDAVNLFNKLKTTEYSSSKSNISIIFVALKSNIAELPALIDLAKDLKINYIKVIHFNTSIQPPHIRKESLYFYKQLANKYFISAKNKAQEYGINLQVKLFEDSEKNKNKTSENQQKYRFPQKCFAPWEKIIIRANGDIAPCCDSGEIMGNIKKEAFENIWNGKKYRNFRRRINTNFPPLDCRGCVQLTGINAGIGQDSKCSEHFSQRFMYFIEHKISLIKLVYHFLKDYIVQ
jgi:radical SAM protein with 4Fe4S-binding SPASM domain